jgi:hypothetical protein
MSSPAKKKTIGRGGRVEVSAVSGDWEHDWDLNEMKKAISDLGFGDGNFDLANMSERIMDALCEDGRGDFLLLKDEEIRAWWTAVTERRRRDAERIAAQRRQEELRENALRKLSSEERRALGLE